MDETLAGTGVVVYHPAYTEGVDVAEATFPRGTTRVGLFVVLPRKVVLEAVVGHRYTVVGMIGSTVRLVPLAVVWRRFQEITVEGGLGFQVVVGERNHQWLRSRSCPFQERCRRRNADGFHVDRSSSIMWDASPVVDRSGNHLDVLMFRR